MPLVCRLTLACHLSFDGDGRLGVVEGHTLFLFPSVRVCVWEVGGVQSSQKSAGLPDKTGIFFIFFCKNF